MTAIISPLDPDALDAPAQFTDLMLVLQRELGGRYLLQRPLGRGGMGIVYLAREHTLDRLVALKVLRPDRATPELRARFLREAKIAAGLQHDHIVPIHAVDEAGPFLYIVMEYIRGQTLLRRLMTDGTLPVGEATRILHDAARAVHYAHQHGVIHRDLTPQNILLREDGKVYVMDFGIARAALLPSLPGSDGHTIGTFGYMSPEQAMGRRADYRSDIYARGLLGYVMAAGKLPFEGSNKDMLLHHVTTPAPPLRVLNQHLDPTLSRCVARCLEKAARNRFHSAGDLAGALAEAPELRADLPQQMGEYVSDLAAETKAAMQWSGVGGVIGVLLLQHAVHVGSWGTAAAGVGFLVLPFAAPLPGVLPATRRFFKQGYSRDTIVHALKMDLDRQRKWRKQRKSTGTRLIDRLAKALRQITLAALGLFGVGALAGWLRAPLPERLVYGSMIVGSLTFVFAGLGYLVANAWSNRLVGRRWLSFWSSWLGKGTAKLVGLGLNPKPLPAALERPRAALLPDSSGAAPNAHDEIEQVRELTETSMVRIASLLEDSKATRVREERQPTLQEAETEDTLGRQLVLMEALRERLLAVDATAADWDSLSVDLDAAREVCDAAQAVMEGQKEVE